MRNDFKKTDYTMMKTANLWSEMSKCNRKKVGAIIAKDNRIISIGYNGNPSGYEVTVKNKKCKRCSGKGRIDELALTDVYGVELNAICPNCGGTGKMEVKKDICDDGINTYSSVIHAEANAILFAAKQGISTNDCTLYVTMSPCIECAKMIVQSGIKEVFYNEKYRNTEGLKLLKECNIEVNQIDFR